MATEKKDKGEFYIAPKDLNKEFRKYFDSSKIPSERVASEELGRMLIKLANHYASKSCFHGYPYKQEFISDAIFKMLEHMHKIDLNHPKANPFSYLTSICYCAFITKIKKYKKQAEQFKVIQRQLYEDFCTIEGISNRKNEIDIYDFENMEPEDLIEKMNSSVNEDEDSNSSED